jgi:hypothetical protein
MGTVCVIATALVACGLRVLLRVTKCSSCVYMSEYIYFFKSHFICNLY